MSSSLEGAAEVVGMLLIFGLATVGAVVVAVLAVLGLSTLTGQLSKISAADELIQKELDRQRLEEMAENE